jgi:hypothetical protein
MRSGVTVPPEERVTTGSEPRRTMPDQRAALERAKTTLANMAKATKESDPVLADTLGSAALAADVALSCSCGGSGELASGWPCICSLAEAQYNVTVEVVEVVEPGHDEQTEERWQRAADEQVSNRRLVRIRELEAELADERERTVAAVVEALRSEADRVEAENGDDDLAGSYDVAANLIEDLPRFKPSAPGGDDGH